MDFVDELEGEEIVDDELENKEFEENDEPDVEPLLEARRFCGKELELDLEPDGVFLVLLVLFFNFSCVW